MTIRTCTVRNVLEEPGTGKPIVGAKVSIRLNTPAFIDGGTREKVRTRYATTDATGLWSVELELNSDAAGQDQMDPVGTSYTVREMNKTLWTFQLGAAQAGQTVNLRDVLVANPSNPNPLTAGVPLPAGTVPSGYVWTTDGAGSGAYLPETGGGGGGAVASVNGQTGTVVLAASDVGADASGAAATAQAAAIAAAATDTTAKVATEATARTAAIATQHTADVAAFDASGAASTAQTAAIAAAATDATTKANAAQAAAQGSSLQKASNLSDVASAATAKINLGLGNVDNTSDVNKPVSTAQQTALNLKAPLASPGLTGTPTAPTASASDNSTKLATTAYADTGDATRIAKSLGTAKGDLVGFSASGTPVRIPAGGDGSVPTYDSTAASGLSAQATLNASSLLLGATNGALKKPWGEQAFIGPELWSATYFDTTTVNSIAGQTSTTPSLTGNSTNQHKMTRFRTGYVSSNGQVQEVYRLDFTLNNTCPSGWAYIAIRGLTTGGATVSGTEIYLWAASDGICTNYRSAFDYKLPPNSGVCWVEIEVGAANNVASGTIGLSNVSFRQVAEARPSLNVSWSNAGSPGPSGTSGNCLVDVPVTDPVTGVTNYLRRVFGNDGQLQMGPTELDMFPSQYQFNYVKPSTTSVSGSGVSNSMPSTGQRKLHVNNAGQIMGVVKADASTELRCNTHGGEWGRRVRTVTDGVVNGTTTLTSATANFTSADVGAAISLTTGMGTNIRFVQSVTNSTTAVMNTVATASGSGVTVGIGNYGTNFTFEMDFGDGSWVALTDGQKTHGCRRFRLTAHTEVMRSDATSPYANVDQIFTVSDDGTMRFDRTITFVADQAIYQWFYFMHSFDTTVLEQGRMGFGQQVLSQTFDPRQYLTAPVAATVTQLTTGTYGSVTRTYYTTAITPQGESTLSPSVASTTASGTTNSFQVNQPATQTGQTGWAIYDSTGRLAVLPVSVTTWVDTGPQFGSAKPPTVNAATVLPGTQQYTRLMSDRADWAAFYDSDSSGVVFGTITDRDNALAYPGATSLTCELDSHPGVLKNYWQLQDATGYQPLATLANLGSYRQTLTNGTVLTTTAYSFLYAPLDRTNWHREIANRGQGFKQFGTVYPST